MDNTVYDPAAGTGSMMKGLKMDHQLEEIEGGWRCTVCNHTWKKHPVYDCPGVVWYEWENAPENLKTKQQIFKMGLRLKQNANSVGCLWWAKNKSWLWLYDLSQTETRPAATEKQLAALAKARAKAKALRICLLCGVEQPSKRYLTDKICERCHNQIRLSQCRQKAVAWARGLMDELSLDDLSSNDLSSWIILDTETTGLGDDAEVISLAMLDPKSGESFSTLLKPQGVIPVETIDIHGITNEMVQDAPTYPDVCYEIARWITGKKVVIYNANFDKRLLSQTAERYGHAITLMTECAMEWYAAYYGEWSDYWMSFKWQPLPGGDHTALGDCRATLALIKNMAGVKDE